MNINLVSLLGAVLACSTALAQTTTSKLEESEVRISYGELKRLLAAAQPHVLTPVAPVPPPPVQAALLACAYRIDWQAGLIIGEMQVENFTDSWQAVPLAGATMGALSVDPLDARLVVVGEDLCLIMEKAGAARITLGFPLADGTATVLHLAPCAVGALDVATVPEGRHLSIQPPDGPILALKKGLVALPASGGTVTLRVDNKADQPASPATGGPAIDEAIIGSASYATQVVRDGSLLTEGTLLIRHDPPMRLRLTLPENSRLLQCHVNGSLVQPEKQGDTGWTILLDDPATDGGESEVRISYTGSVTALEAAEGEINLALPQTPAFAREIDWKVQFPPAYDLTFTGNVDAAAPVENQPGLHLRKSLCRDQQPQARITYRRRTAN